MTDAAGPKDAAGRRRNTSEYRRRSGCELDRESAEKNKYRDLIRELLEAQRTCKSEQLSREQAELFEAAWRAQNPEEESGDNDDDFDEPDAGTPDELRRGRQGGGRQPLAKQSI